MTMGTSGAIGRGLVAFMPKLLAALATIGTAAMLWVGGQIFLNMATGGFGSNVTANTSEELKRVLGGAAYFLTGLTRFAEVRSSCGRFAGPDFDWEGEFLALGIGNGGSAVLLNDKSHRSIVN